MNGHISIPSSSKGDIPIESRVEIYRDPGETQQILVATDNEEVSLDIADPTVSRKKSDKAPVVISKTQAYLQIQNQANTNTVEVTTGSENYNIEQGQVKRVKRDAKISLGFRTNLILKVEQQAVTEVNVGGDVSGDVVMGDSVDKSTSVTDSVVNRADIGSGKGACVDDSAVNRSNLGESSSPQKFGVGGNETQQSGQTQNYCHTHQQTYSGETCPDCTGDSLSRSDVESEDSGINETKFCCYCSDEIPAIVNVCPNCGESLPEY